MAVNVFLPSVVHITFPSSISSYRCVCISCCGELNI